MISRGDSEPDETQRLPGAARLPPADGPAPTQPLGPLPPRGADPDGPALAQAALRWSLLATAVSAGFGLLLGLVVTVLVERLGFLPCICVIVPAGPILSLYRRPFQTIARYEQWRRRHPDQPADPQDVAAVRWARVLAFVAPVLWLLIFLSLLFYIILRVE